MSHIGNHRHPYAAPNAATIIVIQGGGEGLPPFSPIRDGSPPHQQRAQLPPAGHHRCYAWGAPLRDAPPAKKLHLGSPDVAGFLFGYRGCPRERSGSPPQGALLRSACGLGQTVVSGTSAHGAARPPSSRKEGEGQA